MSDPLEKFQQLLWELFQFDSADLDFGIYRIMNYKRAVVEKFIAEDLPQAVARNLDQGGFGEQAQTEMVLKEAATEVRQNLGADAIDADGNLEKSYVYTRVGKKYVEAKAQADAGLSREALEVSIFNHLYTFFSRCYQDGDFISKRRYSRRQKYAIPYNGEEVYLHWANHDQYYVKTAEHFQDYTFSAHGVQVHFKLAAAEVEQNNVKGDKRFFLPLAQDMTWDEAAGELVIPVEYRPLTEAEEKTYDARNQQEAILDRARKGILEGLRQVPRALQALEAKRAVDADGEGISYLDYHLRQYTRRNTSDFFIHKDLKAFLAQELDFYLKNEVLNLDEMQTAGEEKAEGWFQMLRTIKTVGADIIDFLAQIENFQKLLWEKRKFVTECHYCITVGNIDEGLYAEIAACPAQWDEWRVLYHIHELPRDLFSGDLETPAGRLAFLQAHPTLALDTRHFEPAFVDRLLAGFEDLDSMTDGLLVHSENWQALSLLLEKYRESVRSIHIDPPYNTQTSGFLYKNEYPHASWLSMMYDRIAASVKLMSTYGSFLCHIDENEYERLHLLFTHMGIPDGGTIVWDKRNPMLGRNRIATQHEYILWRTWDDSTVYTRPTSARCILEKTSALIGEHGQVDDRVRREFSDWIRDVEGLTGGERAYRLIDDDGRVFQSVGMAAPEPRGDPKFHVPLIHPITGKECPVPATGWSRAPNTLLGLMARNEIVFGKDEMVQPRRKVFLTDESGRQLSSVISDTKRGKNDVAALGLDFPYCHPVSLYEELLGAGAPNERDVVLDHFAGSGTTGHAVVSLNRVEGGNRQFILVEMGEYFDTILLPRIKKVTFSPEWQDGRPKRLATQEETDRSPHIIKVIRLESYEDALNNIELETAAGQYAMQFDDYLLKYMLRWEAKRSQTLLNVDQLARPFAYKLHLHRDGETHAQPVDVTETFNYLIGLHVHTRRVYDDRGKRYLVYRGKVDQRRVVVIWRDIEGWGPADYDRDQAFVAAQCLTEGADEVFVNGDASIPEAQPLELVFKARMFAPVEV